MLFTLSELRRYGEEVLIHRRPGYSSFGTVSRLESRSRVIVTFDELRGSGPEAERCNKESQEVAFRSTGTDNFTFILLLLQSISPHSLLFQNPLTSKLASGVLQDGALNTHLREVAATGTTLVAVSHPLTSSTYSFEGTQDCDVVTGLRPGVSRILFSNYRNHPRLLPLLIVKGLQHEAALPRIARPIAMNPKQDRAFWKHEPGPGPLHFSSAPDEGQAFISARSWFHSWSKMCHEISRHDAYSLELALGGTYLDMKRHRKGIATARGVWRYQMHQRQSVIRLCREFWEEGKINVKAYRPRRLQALILAGVAVAAQKYR
ncbi:uncharacterized protein MYCFIDRAFT_169115 [Pseudocercospora fijiensis CIRAD86]|uniref:Uncharacterized protein n=1 Tax=Pseudocercospora fijiensis (strain CIRAD86) TaxID=383855 RepID=N1Q5P8_PSEFD|nr:uncharacterized protein MYCFIDRAFT_169115 [Pseudocercospora fijiensis CIRAD86]EME87254.1 hypothetical protein MYCFIDRAFT_169115 [Pseudocercospora fijiensis CIRAD86]